MSPRTMSKTSLKDIKNSIMTEKRREKRHPFFPTGSTLLDLIVGGGTGMGYEGGKIINLVGDKSSGKTFLACELIAAAHKKYGAKVKHAFADAESGFSFANSMAMFGVEIIPTGKSACVHRPRRVEDFYCDVREFLESLKGDQFGIYALDSLDGLTSKEGDEMADDRFELYKKGKDLKQGSYRMGKPKYLSQELFPQLADLIERKNALIVIISQVRENLDFGSFDKYKRNGGKALDHYCSTVLWLAQVRKIKTKGRAVGVVVKVKTTKSKTPRPYREGFITILFDYGIDDVGSNVDYLYDLLTPTGMAIGGSKKDGGEGEGKKIAWGEGHEKSLANLRAFLAQNDLEKKYRTTVNPKLKKSEVLKWLKTQDEKIVTRFEETFEGNMTRRQLVEYIDKKHLEDELARKVVEKWEAVENELRTKRRPKYA